jgi:orotate phosphoribosyltransferase
MSINTLYMKLWDANILEICDIKLKNKTDSKYYCDMRKILSFPDLLKDVFAYTIKRFIFYKDNKDNKDNITYDLIAGVPMGGIPYATLLSSKLELPLILPRSSIKNYGKQNEIDGYFKLCQKVILVEDVITTGAGILNTIKILERNGLQVSLIIVLMDRCEGGIDYIESKGYKIFPIFSMANFIICLNQGGKITEYDYEIIMNHSNLQKNKLIKSLLKDKYNQNINNINSENNGINDENIKDIDEDDDDDERVKGLKKQLNVKREYHPILKTYVRSTLLNMVVDKKTNLCLNINNNISWIQVKNIINDYGKHIVIFILNSDLYHNYNLDIIKEILELQKKYSFFIMDDKCLVNNIFQSNYNIFNNLTNYNDSINIMSFDIKNIHSICNEYNQNINSSKKMVNPLFVCQSNIKPEYNIYNNLDESVEKKTHNHLIELLKSDLCDNINLIECQNCIAIKDKLKLSRGILFNKEFNYDVDEYKYNTFISVNEAIIHQENHLLIIDYNHIKQLPLNEFQNNLDMSWSIFKTKHCKIYQDILYLKDYNITLAEFLELMKIRKKKQKKKQKEEEEKEEEEEMKK